MERKRASRVRFRLGRGMEASSTRKGSKTALLMDKDNPHSDKCLPNFFVPTMGEPYVKYKIPRYDFEKWDWMLFQWPHERADANFEMTNINFEASIQADNKGLEELIDGKLRQREEKKIEPPPGEPDSTEYCIQNLLDDSAFCFTDVPT